MTRFDRVSRRETLALISGTMALFSAPGWAKAALNGPDKTASKSKRLILLELFGGNDALNTLVPYADPLYQYYRPTIGIARDDVLRLSDDVGFNPAFRGLANVFERGELAVIQDVGYPHPNLSHFGSAAIWASADGQVQRASENGWIGRVLTANRSFLPSMDADGIILSGDQDLLKGENLQVLSMTDSKAFLQDSARMINPKLDVDGHRALAHLQHLLRDKEAIAERVQARLKGQNRFDAWFIKDNYLGPLDAQVSLLLWLIESGVETPMYKLSISGFDMHANLRGQHEQLLGKVQSTVLNLRRGLIDIGVWDDTLIVVQSEFGRRPEENASGGTDHGTSGPVLLAGGGLAGGIYGARSDLSRLDEEGNLGFGVDFRQIYSAIIQNFWGMTEDPMMKAGFSPLQIKL
jgi:uncharacterized protein (DUF1501 family)